MRIILSSLLLLCVSASYAQFETGQKLLGGQLSASFARTENSSSPFANYSNNMFLNFSFSKFTSSLALKGISVGYGYTFQHNFANDPVNDQRAYQHTFNLSAYRTKLQPMVRNLYLAFTGSLNGSYGFGRTTNVVNSDSDLMYAAVGLSGSLGIWYRLSPRFILTGELANLVNLSYTHVQSDSPPYRRSRYNEDHISLAAGLSGTSFNSLAVGVRYLLK